MINRELKRAIRNRAREVFEMEFDLDGWIYNMQRKGFELGNGKHFGGFGITPEQWDEVRKECVELYEKAFRRFT